MEADNLPRMTATFWPPRPSTSGSFAETNLPPRRTRVPSVGTRVLDKAEAWQGPIYSRRDQDTSASLSPDMLLFLLIFLTRDQVDQVDQAKMYIEVEHSVFGQNQAEVASVCVHPSVIMWKTHSNPQCKKQLGPVSPLVPTRFPLLFEA